MKKFLSFLTALAFASTAMLADAAPRAAEDPTASVVSTSYPAPKARKHTAKHGKKHASAHKAAKKPAKKGKKAGKKAKKAKKSPAY